MAELNNRDPHNLKTRLENIASIIFDRIEKDPAKYETKELLSTIQIIGMWLTRETKLADSSDSNIAGSAVRKYAGAFQSANATGRGKSYPRPRTVSAGDEGDDPSAA